MSNASRHFTCAAGERAQVGQVLLQRRAGAALLAVHGVQLGLRHAGIQLSRLQPEQVAQVLRTHA